MEGEGGRGGDIKVREDRRRRDVIDIEFLRRF